VEEMKLLQFNNKTYGVRTTTPDTCPEQIILGHLSLFPQTIGPTKFAHFDIRPSL